MCCPFRYQQQAYNGYKKVHSLKYQAVKIPNGLLGHIHGPEVGWHNDNHLLTTSGLLDFCTAHAVCPGTSMNTPPAQCYLQLFGDPAYGNSHHILSPFSGAGECTDEEKRWNKLRLSMVSGVLSDYGHILMHGGNIKSMLHHLVFNIMLDVCLPMHTTVFDPTRLLSTSIASHQHWKSISIPDYMYNDSIQLYVYITCTYLLLLFGYEMGRLESDVTLQLMAAWQEHEPSLL